MNTLRMPLILIALVLGACSAAKTAVPTGQVVATIDGHEITAAELRAEVGDLSASGNPADRKNLEQNALELIVARYLLAEAARTRKLDQTPLASILERRSTQMALADLMQRQLRRDVPIPSRDEAQIYVSDHPASFAQRSIVVVEQFVARGASPAVVKAMEPLNTMDEVAALLSANKVPFTRTVGVIDALTIDPDSAQRIAALPLGAIFVSPEGDVTRINRIRDAQVSPVTGEDAIRVAQEALQGQRGAQLLQQQMNAIIAAGLPRVRYNPAYQPKQAIRLPGVDSKPSSQPTSAPKS